MLLQLRHELLPATADLWSLKDFYFLSPGKRV